MAKHSHNKADISRSVSLAIKEIATFPGVEITGHPVPFQGGWEIEAVFAVPLPHRSVTAGVSSTGVRSCESVYFRFPADYPQKAPAIRLRRDFPRNLPHINPGKANDLVAPCVYDGSLDDLLHLGRGLTEILEQVQSWLAKAASNSLINPNQGWEPIRYDEVNRLISYEHSELCKLVTRAAGNAFLLANGMESEVLARYSIDDFTPKTLDGYYAEYVANSEKKIGAYLASIRPLLFCWPDESAVVSEYLPETITNLDELVERSRTYGTYERFWQPIQSLWGLLGGKASTVDVIVVHCVRRPYPLINQQTNLELLGYRVRAAYSSSTGFLNMNAPVEPIGHTHAVGPDLLRRLSGSTPGPSKFESIIQIGCGSLGSKIALHLARAGHGPFTLIDDKYMSEHNLARHSLTRVNGNKAELLKKDLDVLKIKAGASTKSLQGYLEKKKDRLFVRNNLVIDSTASICVKETLASLPPAQNNSRVVHTGLYSEGRLGFITIEGQDRNPRIDDLHAALCDSAIDSEVTSKFLMGSDKGFQRQQIGQGCGSFTMVMPDTTLSLHAAAMAERVRRALEGNIRDDGEILLGYIDGSGISLQWSTTTLGRTRRVKLDNQDWELRILAPAYTSMVQEAERWPYTETGGVLIGHLSLARKCAIVTRVLEPPSDSERSHSCFMLGIEGLTGRIQNIAKSSGLSYLGTWHSHLCGSSPSQTDTNTLKKISELKLGIPSFNLILAEGDLTCLLKSLERHHWVTLLRQSPVRLGNTFNGLSIYPCHLGILSPPRNNILNLAYNFCALSLF